MDLRTVKRVFLFNKSIKSSSINKSEFWILTSIMALGIGQCCRFSNIYHLLKKINRLSNPVAIYSNLKSLVGKGHIIRVGNVYSITAKGHMILFEIENKLRKVRLDKIIQNI